MIVALKRKQKRRIERLDIAGDLAQFGEHHKEAELARISLQEEQLNFEKEKYAKESEQRERDRRERKEERDAAPQFELEKFKIMFDVFKQHSK